MLNEADTRAKLIDPRLHGAGWGEDRIVREHYFQRDRAFTRGRVILVGDEPRRREPKKVDYLLRYADTMPIAVVEDIESIRPQFEAHVLRLGYSERLLQRCVELVEPRSSSRVSSDVAIDEREINELASQAVSGARAAGAGRSQEGVLDG